MNAHKPQMLVIVDLIHVFSFRRPTNIIFGENWELTVQIQETLKKMEIYIDITDKNYYKLIIVVRCTLNEWIHSQI